MKTVSCLANTDLNPLFSSRIPAILDGVRVILAALLTFEHSPSCGPVNMDGRNLDHFLLSSMAFVK